jgi:dihydroorotate dehydrogenase
MKTLEQIANDIKLILVELNMYSPNRQNGIAIHHLTQAIEALKNDLLK